MKSSQENLDYHVTNLLRDRVLNIRSTQPYRLLVALSFTTTTVNYGTEKITKTGNKTVSRRDSGVTVNYGLEQTTKTEKKTVSMRDSTTT